MSLLLRVLWGPELALYCYLTVRKAGKCPEPYLISVPATIQLSSHTEYPLAPFIPLIEQTQPFFKEMVSTHLITESNSEYRNSVLIIALELDLIVCFLFPESHEL